MEGNMGKMMAPGVKIRICKKALISRKYSEWDWERYISDKFGMYLQHTCCNLEEIKKKYMSLHQLIILFVLNKKSMICVSTTGWLIFLCTSKVDIRKYWCCANVQWGRVNISFIILFPVFIMVMSHWISNLHHFLGKMKESERNSIKSNPYKVLHVFLNFSPSIWKLFWVHVTMKTGSSHPQLKF